MFANSEQFDVVIVGGGPGGMAAALWCSDLGLSSLLIDDRNELGGQLLHVFNSIRNYPGVSARNGSKLRDLFVRSLADRNFFQHLGDRVESIEPGSSAVILASGARYYYRALIIATGVRRRKLGVPGEDEFTGKGILSSGMREAGSVAGKRVLVVGGGDAAIENALILAEHASEVIVVHRRPDFKARSEFLQKAMANKKIEFRTRCIVRSFRGGTALECAVIEDTIGEVTRTEVVDHALIRIGFVPNSEPFSSNLKCDENGYMLTDRQYRTNCHMVYAIGDVAEPVGQTVSAACGAASVVSKNLQKYLEKMQKSTKV